MFGLEAISAHNGWTMAVVGAAIVFSGLVILSFAISQIHKLMLFWDRKSRYFNSGAEPKSAPPEIPAPTPTPPGQVLCPSDLPAMAILYRPLVESLETSFQLTDLYTLAQEHDFPHPHLTLTCLRQANYLKPQGDGYFTWSEPQQNHLDES
ncbi:MAG TPA: OadG family protein [Desulfobacterales bacterium]|nr:OadG family protein [Desulfobacterales bacterium]